MKLRILILLCILLICPSVSALGISYQIDGYGTWSTGEFWISAGGALTGDDTIYYRNDREQNVYTKITLHVFDDGYSAGSYYANIYNLNWVYMGQPLPPNTVAVGTTESRSYTCVGDRILDVHGGRLAGQDVHAVLTFTASEIPIVEFSATGTTGCLNYIELYIKNSSSMWDFIDKDLSPNSYSFTIINQSEYKLSFSDGTSYEFLCNNSSVQFDLDTCEHCNLTINDNCGYKMSNTSVDIYKSEGGDPATYRFVDNYWATNPISLLLGTDCNLTDQLDIFIITDQGTEHKLIYADNQTHNLFHSTKYWVFTLIAEDDETGVKIEGVKTQLNQSCKINSATPLKTYTYTNNQGKATFGGLSSALSYVWMYKSGEYKSERFYCGFGFGAGGDAFNTNYYFNVEMNASTNDSLPDWENETENVSAECAIHFQNQGGHIRNRINDTDSYVDLYYDNGNCSSVLRFEKCYGTYWMNKISWNIPINESGYKRILNTNFSDYTYNYRGRMYSYECECNSTLRLYVTNETAEEEQHYQNLTTYTCFKHKLAGDQIDYRSPVEIYAYANATDAFLLDINLTLYNNTQEIASYQTNWADYAGATKKWWYIWTPTIEYDIGENYTIVMSGYNGLNLSSDSVWTSDIKQFTIFVYTEDQSGNALSNCKIYMQGWGEIEMDTTTFTSISGLSSGEYQIQATKSGYTSSGWQVANLTEGDASITLTLRQIAGTTTVVGVKMRDSEIKNIYIPLMYILLIMIIFGGLWYVSRS